MVIVSVLIHSKTEVAAAVKLISAGFLQTICLFPAFRHKQGPCLHKSIKSQKVKEYKV